MKDKEVAFLEYAFMFDPSETWSNLYQFEDALAKYFDECGLEAVVVKTVTGQAGKRILMLNKKPMIERVEEPKKKEKQISVGEKFRKLQPKK